MSASATASHVHESRFGYHPCDRDTFLKLKALNKVFQDALRRKAAYERWERKEPHNRFTRRKIRNNEGFVIGHEKLPMTEPKLNVLLTKVDYQSGLDRSGSPCKPPMKRTRVGFVPGAELIGQEYKYARTPRPDERGIRQLAISVETIDRLLQLCQK